MQSGAEGERHQLVVCGVVLDRVDAVAETVVRHQLGRVAVGLRRERLQALAADQLAHAVRALCDPAAAFALDRRLEDPILRPGVVAGERRRLVEALELAAAAGRSSFTILKVASSSEERCPAAASASHRDRLTAGRIARR